MELQEVYKKLNNFYDLEDHRKLTAKELIELGNLKQLRNKLDPTWNMMNTEEDILKEIDKLLQHKSQLSDSDYNEALKLRKETLECIQKELLDKRRKKINKLMNIPEPPRTHKMTDDMIMRLEKARKNQRYEQKKQN